MKLKDIGKITSFKHRLSVLKIQRCRKTKGFTRDSREAQLQEVNLGCCVQVLHPQTSYFLSLMSNHLKHKRSHKIFFSLSEHCREKKRGYYLCSGVSKCISFHAWGDLTLDQAGWGDAVRQTSPIQRHQSGTVTVPQLKVSWSQRCRIGEVSCAVNEEITAHTAVQTSCPPWGLAVLTTKDQRCYQLNAKMFYQVPLIRADMISKFRSGQILGNMH